MAFLPSNISKFFKQFFTKDTFLPDEWTEDKNGVKGNKEDSKTGKTDVSLPKIQHGYTTDPKDSGIKELNPKLLNALTVQISELSEKVKELTDYIEGNRYRNNLIPYTCFLGLDGLNDQISAYKPVYNETSHSFRYINIPVNASIINLTDEYTIPYLSINGDYVSMRKSHLSPAKVTKIDNNPFYTHFSKKPSSAKFLCKHNFTYNDIMVDGDGVGYNYGLEFAKVMSQFYSGSYSKGVYFNEVKMSDLTDIRKTLENSGYDPNRYYNDNDKIAFIEYLNIPRNATDLALYIGVNHGNVVDTKKHLYNIGLPSHYHSVSVPHQNLKYKYTSSISGSPGDTYTRGWAFTSVPPFKVKKDGDFILALNPISKSRVAGTSHDFDAHVGITTHTFNTGATPNIGVDTGPLDVRGNRVYFNLFMVI